MVEWCRSLQTASLVDELLGEFNAWKEDLPKIDALKDSLDSLRSEVCRLKKLVGGCMWMHVTCTGLVDRCVHVLFVEVDLLPLL